MPIMQAAGPLDLKEPEPEPKPEVKKVVAKVKKATVKINAASALKGKIKS
jgi:hypothetical protein